MVPDRSDHRWRFILPDLLIAAIVLMGAAGGLRIAFDLSAAVPVVALVVLAVLGVLLWRHQGFRPLTPADRVTLGRAILVLLLIALLPGASALPDDSGIAFALGLVAVLLDGVDGAVARYWHCETREGARFDMELDALLLLVLCGWLVATERAGIWVLAIGGWRYAFVLAGWWLPALRRPLPPSQRRRVICGVQGFGLVVCLAPGMPAAAVTTLALGLFVLLSYSFIVDIAVVSKPAAS